MSTCEGFRLTELTTCGGCASKAGPGWLDAVVRPLSGLFQATDFPKLLVGLTVPDDAAVYRVSRSSALVATVDFFAPLVDDPFTFGEVAAANAMSDVFAMGAEVALALNVAAFPETLPPSVAAEVLRGGAAKVLEAGGAMAGGHTILDDEPKYGLCILGFVDPRKMLSKAALRSDQFLYLTKPLGVGTILSGVRNDVEVAHSAVGAATDCMLRLNRSAAGLAVDCGVRAATDVTGFGLLGHLWEMVSRSGVQAEVWADAVPILDGARELSLAGVHTSGEERNRLWVDEGVEFAADVHPPLHSLLYDPQTSGGLLFSCSRRKAVALEERFAAAREPLWRIGRTRPGHPRIGVLSSAPGRSAAHKELWCRNHDDNVCGKGVRRTR